MEQDKINHLKQVAKNGFMDITSGKNKMAFDCYCIDFQNKKRIENIEIIKQNFPYIKIIPFVKSYYDMAQMIV